ncbi:MAG: crotonase/enoyl-CoA hydratase family protein [Deltaproteobacteria bacterium]|nr:crotonase/enoyl-CoA hydratase family protein [Deltaproteobacteria bacterium]
MDNPLRIEKDGYVATVTLARPEKRNAMTQDMFSGFSEIFGELDGDAKIRAVILRAEGKSFTAGIDLGEAAGLLQQSTTDARERLKKWLMTLQDSLTSIERCSKPVIAAVHGHCIGGGVDLMCACDIRIAARNAIFSVRETRMAMIADLGTLQRLPTIIGQGWLRELALTGRDFTADEALQMGFVTRVTADRESLQAEARRLADEIASNSPLAVQGAKEVILYSRDHGIRAGLEFVAQKNSSVLHCDDLMEAVSAFMMKKKPDFKGK